MKNILKIAILSMNVPNNENSFNAKVLYKGIDCGDTFLIQFNNNAINVPENFTDNIFYAINLPQQYKIEGLEININFRKPYDNEIMACSMMGITYPQIFVE